MSAAVSEAPADIIRRWANWIIDESADRDDVSDHDAGKRKVRAERDLILTALQQGSGALPASPSGGQGSSAAPIPTEGEGPSAASDPHWLERAIDPDGWRAYDANASECRFFGEELNPIPHPRDFAATSASVSAAARVRTVLTERESRNA